MELPVLIQKKLNAQGQTVVLFDGVCNLCNSSINYIITHDKKQTLKFASLQSSFGQHIKKHVPDEVDSIVFLENGKIFIKSEAILKIAKYLGFPYNLLLAGKIIPVKWRDAWYDYIAKNRYAWLGQSNTCRVATTEERSRFIENF